MGIPLLMPDRGYSHYDPFFWPQQMTCEVDDVPLMQPVGFVWHSKPRYRVKAISRQID